MEIFETCQNINELLQLNDEDNARNLLIRLLDYHYQNNIEYSQLINHLIRRTGLYPYINIETSNWQERYVYEAFKVNTGDIENITLHRAQSELLKELLNGENIAVSAPTSFGKSFVIDAFVAIKKPKNVVIVVPTIALTDETRRRLYKKFANTYKIITTTDVELSDYNIFIFPQERAINYVDKLEDIDILIIDEFYKASSNFDRDRSPTLIKAILKLGKIAKQKYFLAPNISTIDDNPFTRDMKFIPLKFNTVFLETHELYKRINKNEKLKSEIILDILHKKQTKSLIYAGTYSNIEKLTTLFLSSIKDINKKLLNDFSNWLSENYDVNWSLTKLVKKGIGVHNGRLHRSISQIQVKLFEERKGLNNLISTSSIIEGVNTSAENVIIWMNKNGNKTLNDFTYKNIIGRGGRMFKHFIGQIYILEPPPKDEKTQLEIPFPEEILGDINKDDFASELTKEQVAKIVIYQEEMNELLGEDIYNKIKAENIFQTSNSETIKKIAIDMKFHPNEWNGLNYLNSSNTNHWTRMLFKIIRFEPSGWEANYTTIVEFTKALRVNWFRSIPEMLKRLEPYDISVDDFFKLERKITFKLSALLKDVNILQKEIFKDKNNDISRFANYASHAFLPPVVYQLEEFGLPRMISRKIHKAKLINFHSPELTIHKAIDMFKKIGSNTIISNAKLKDFELYIIDYFYDGIDTIKK
jgi:hypothetical protein